MADNDRIQIRIFVSPAAKKVVEDWAQKYDMTEQGLASRIYEWFGRQPRAVQKLVAGLFEEGEGSEALREFANALLESAEPGKKGLKGHITKGDSVRRI